MLRREDGSGVTYVSYFVAMVIMIVVFYWQRTSASIYVLEEIAENGLHIAENYALSANQTTTDDGGGVRQFERELDRLAVITVADTQDASENYIYAGTTALSSEESLQARAVAEALLSEFKRQLNLSGANPQDGILKNLCGEDGSIEVTTIRIIEPIYERTVTPVHFVPGAPFDSYDFQVTYNKLSWVEYDVTCANNQVASIAKQVSTSAPLLNNGHPAEGATIESYVGMNFGGMRNVFATNPGEDGYFATPTQQRFAVTVVQAVDIVIAQDDSRIQ